MPGAIFLFDEDNWGRKGACAGADNAFVEHFENEGGHGVLVSMWVAVGFNVN